MGSSAIFALQAAICYSLVSSLKGQSKHNFINNQHIKAAPIKTINMNVTPSALSPRRCRVYIISALDEMGHLNALKSTVMCEWRT